MLRHRIIRFVDCLRSKLQTRLRDTFFGFETRNCIRKLTEPQQQTSTANLLDALRSAVAYMNRWFQFAPSNPLHAVKCLGLVEPKLVFDDIVNWSADAEWPHKCRCIIIRRSLYICEHVENMTSRHAAKRRWKMAGNFYSQHRPQKFVLSSLVCFKYRYTTIKLPGWTHFFNDVNQMGRPRQEVGESD